MINAKTLAGALSLAAVFAAAGVSAQQAPNNRPTFTPDGVVHVPAFDLPPSVLMSPEAVAMTLKPRAAMPPSNPLARDVPIEQQRAGMERRMAPLVAAAQKRYPVDIASKEIAGVKTRVFTPKNGEADASRVLINLHGGAFMMCAEGCAMVESIPVAGAGRYKVVSVDYRQAPEHVFPAASEDVAAVYKALLKDYRPENIGIYGCSAGGTLAAQSQAWFLDKGLPSPGALGIFGAGAVRFGAGDSAYIAGYIDGSFPPPRDGDGASGAGYFKGAKMDSPLVSPAKHPDVLAKFPPTLLITGTRATDMSSAIYTHTELVKAGGKGNLIVGEGMGHCYIYMDMPEAHDAIGIIVKFFDEHLGTKRALSAAR